MLVTKRPKEAAPGVRINMALDQIEVIAGEGTKSLENVHLVKK